MANSVDAYGAYSGRPAYQLHLIVWRAAVTGNNSAYSWVLRAEKISTGTAWSSNATGWSVNLGGQTWSGNAALDFRSTNTIDLASGGSNWYAHDANGNFGMNVSASHNGDSPFGFASCSATFNTDRIAQVPGAPNPIGITQIGPTSFVYQFSGTTDGGAAITGWTAQVATDAGFTANLQTVSSSGTTTFAGLNPGTLYCCRSRGQNSVGAGAWSSVISATTLSGAFVGHSSNGTFVPVAVYVAQDNTYVLTEVRVGQGGSFVVAS